MDELIVRVLRTIACATRLRILARLMRADEVSPSQLARDCHVRPDVLSVHLARLTSAGLIQRRRSGAKHYCSARSPYSESTLSGKVVAWLRDALPTSAQGPPAETSAQTRAARPSPEAHRAVFDAATAFTHPRRIQILRRLAQGKPPNVATLSRDLRMSKAAVSRHTDKLMRRGYVRPLPPARGTTYQLVRKGKTPLHGRLLAIVSRHWAGRDVAR
ncbi:MAG TPA: MarR family transcriptional regulator [Planctomycetota bacterium]|nr:MarR family transcriptional regulator [Planctomycetota bacterium]